MNRRARCKDLRRSPTVREEPGDMPGNTLLSGAFSMTVLPGTRGSLLLPDHERKKNSLRCSSAEISGTEAALCLKKENSLPLTAVWLPQGLAAFHAAVPEMSPHKKRPFHSAGAVNDEVAAKDQLLLQQQDSPSFELLRRAFRMRLRSVPSRIKPPAIMAISLMTRRPAPDR